jgi:hypothetical protein
MMQRFEPDASYCHVQKGSHQPKHMASPSPQSGLSFASYLRVVWIWGLTLALCAFCSSSRLATLASLILFFSFYIYIVMLDARLFAKYLAVFFAITANVLGVAVVELSAVQLPELAVSSEFAGSFPLLALSRWLFIAVLIAYDLQFGVEKRRTERAAISWSAYWLMKIGTYIIFGVCVVLFVSVARYPSFLEGVDRFSYSQEHLSGVMSIASGWMCFFIIIPILYFKKTQSKIGMVTVLLYAVFLFWTGTKFGGFFSLLCMVILAYYDRFQSIPARLVKRTVIVLAASVVVLIGFSVLANSFVTTKSSVSFLSDRLAQQGQLWWKTYTIGPSSDTWDLVDQDIKGQLAGNESVSENVGSKYGIYGVMYHCADSSRVDAQLNKGARYTEAGYACVYYYFGVVGPLVFSVLMALILGALQNYYLRAISLYSVIEAVVLARFSALFAVGLSMFDFTGFFGRASYLSLLVLIIIHCVRKRQAGRVQTIPGVCHERCQND